MTYEMVEMTNQVATAHWGWTIGFFLWFVGLAGMGMFLNYWIRSKRVLVVSTGAVILGTLLVVSHLGRILNLPMAAINALIEWQFNFTSWMFIGICILAVTCVVTVLQVLGLKKCAGAFSEKMLLVDAVLGVAATAYSGFLLTQAAGVPLWNTAVLPVLWLASGLACAFGLVEAMSASGKLDVATPKWLGTGANMTHIAEAFIIFAFVQVALAGTPGAVNGAQALLSGDAAALFWGGAVGLGIVIPMIIGFMMKKNHTALMVGGLCAIVGALCLRSAVLFAGYFDPILF